MTINNISAERHDLNAHCSWMSASQEEVEELKMIAEFVLYKLYHVPLLETSLKRKTQAKLLSRVVYQPSLQKLTIGSSSFCTIDGRAATFLDTDSEQAKRLLPCTKWQVRDKRLQDLKNDYTLDKDEWAPKNAALFTAACCPLINAISFTPENPDAFQLLYAERGEGVVSLHGFFILNANITQFPMTIPAKVSYISDANSLNASIVGLSRFLIQDITNILLHFLQDRHTKALALNFSNSKRSSTTQLWIKR